MEFFQRLLNAYKKADKQAGGWLPGGGTASPLTRAKQEGERNMANQIRQQSQQYVGQPGRLAGRGQLSNVVRATTQAGTNPVSVALGDPKAVEKVSQYYAQYPEMQNEFDLNTNMFLRYLSGTGADGLKIAPVQKLEPGVYPEHMVYLKSAGLCGQSDLVEVVNGRVNIIDYKTNNEIKTESFKDWEGISEKLMSPVNNLDDCNFNHYSLQLSIYMYIILKHNPKLQPGKMYIHHVLFDIEGVDEFGYPITKYDHNNDPVVKEVIPMEIPYLKDEVISIINWLHDNRDNIKKK